jgi:glycosyltransferase involved in cell wall biosynthesis
VITTRGGCFEEAAGKSALFVNPDSPGEIASAMLQLLKNPTARENLSKTGQQQLALFESKRITDDLMAVYYASVQHAPMGHPPQIPS